MESGVVEVLGVLSRIRLVADVDVMSFVLGSNKFGFELEFALEERSGRFGVEDDAEKLFADPTPNDNDEDDVKSFTDFRGRPQNCFFSFRVPLPTVSVEAAATLSSLTLTFAAFEAMPFSAYLSWSLAEWLDWEVLPLGTVL